MAFVLGGGLGAADWVAIPAGELQPFFAPAGSPPVSVPAFRLQRQAVTNAEFLQFVRAVPAWRRSSVPALLADADYLGHWAGDLELGPAAPAEAPVVRVSWAAARAYATWIGARLPSVREWERAAAEDGSGRPVSEVILDWYAQPAPAVLPAADVGASNALGLLNLHGLIWEWTEDFRSGLSGPDSRQRESLDRGRFCGASALSARDRTDYAAFMRYAYRDSLKGPSTGRLLGFRCAADLSDGVDTAPVAAPVSASPWPVDSLYRLGGTWTNQAGETLRWPDLAGRPRVVTMLFTHCAYACPRMLDDLKAIEAALSPAERAQVGFVLITFDDVRDTPERLAAWARENDLGAAWTLLHGTPSQIRAAAVALDIPFQAVEGGGFGHGNRIVVLDSQGRPTHAEEGLGTAPELIAQPLRKLLGE